MSRRPFLTAVVLWALLALAVLAANRELIFSTDVHETGDFAVNALQIDHAKRFSEIYGNYSRFHFHHPGPVFFYTYAMSERLLFDALAIVPSPANAHIAAGIVLQCGFFVLALVLLADVLAVRGANVGVGSGRRGAVEVVRGQSETGPTFFVGLLVGALHFGFVKNAITGIWPPEVLLMPFLAFFAAAVSVALGRVDRLPWMVLAGSFLVHGHVAQPLFVVGLAVFAYGHVVRKEGRPWSAALRNVARRYRWAHGLGAAIMLLFLAPLAIDLARGGQNFRTILLHLHGNGGGGKNVIQSALYFLTFVTHAPAPEELLETLGGHSLRFITEHMLLFSFWLLCLVVFAWGARRTSAHASVDGGLRLLWRFWWVTVLLCVVWGLLQEGPMYSFNGYFYHALHFIVYLGAATVVVRRCASLPRWTAAPATAGALVIAFLLIRVANDRIDHGGIQLRNATQRALALDPHPDRPKLLVFAHNYWSYAASVALALQRAGVPFRVEPEMEFMFQDRATARRDELTRIDPPFSIWRFVDAAASATGPLIDHGRGIRFEPTALSPDGGTIQFGYEDGFIAYQLAGVSDGQHGRSWTTDPEVVLQFRPQPAPSDVVLSLEARPFTHPRGPRQQRLELRFNGELLWTGAFTEQAEIEVQIPRELWNAQTTAHLWLHLPDAASPVELGSSGDWRVLGLEMSRISLRLAGAETTSPTE